MRPNPTGHGYRTSNTISTVARDAVGDLISLQEKQDRFEGEIAVGQSEDRCLAAGRREVKNDGDKPIGPE